MANYRIETDAADHASTFARTSASGKPFIESLLVHSPQLAAG